MYKGDPFGREGADALPPRRMQSVARQAPATFGTKPRAFHFGVSPHPDRGRSELVPQPAIPPSCVHEIECLRRSGTPALPFPRSTKGYPRPMAKVVTFGSQLRRESRPDRQRKGSSDISTNSISPSSNCRVPRFCTLLIYIM
jgi:hypothetical protein